MTATRDYSEFDWMNEGSCRSYVPATGSPWPWDTDHLRGKHAAEIMARREGVAKGICASCPVRDRCLTEGLMLDVATDMPDGIWGGKTPEERAPLVGKGIKWISGMRRFATAGKEVA